MPGPAGRVTPIHLIAFLRECECIDVAFGNQNDDKKQKTRKKTEETESFESTRFSVVSNLCLIGTANSPASKKVLYVS